jgi:hypothetical protein
MDVHTDGAKEGDVVIVTNEPVLTAVLDKRLAVSVALERGLIVVDGEGKAAVETVRYKVIAALDVRALAAASAAAPQAVRLFGPARQ